MAFCIMCIQESLNWRSSTSLSLRRASREAPEHQHVHTYGISVRVRWRLKINIPPNHEHFLPADCERAHEPCRYPKRPLKFMRTNSRASCVIISSTEIRKQSRSARGSGVSMFKARNDRLQQQRIRKRNPSRDDLEDS